MIQIVMVEQFSPWYLQNSKLVLILKNINLFVSIKCQNRCETYILTWIVSCCIQISIKSLNCSAKFGN